MDVRLTASEVTARLVARTFGVPEPDEVLEDALADGHATVDELADAVLDGRGRDHPLARVSRSVEEVAAQQRSFRVSLEVQQVSARVMRAEVAGGRVRVVEAEVQAVSVSLEVQTQDPLIIDLDGDGIETSGVADGARFDLDGDGDLDRMSTVTGGDAFVAIDRDGNGRIDDGRELVGDHHGAADGIAELARFDEDGDGRITRADGVWARMGLWRPGEALVSLDDAGIAAIDLARIAYRGTATGGDALVDALTVHHVDGSTRQAADAWLAFAQD